MFQLDGHDWTQIFKAFLVARQCGVGRSTSRERLRTTAFQHLGEGVYQGYDMHGRFGGRKPVESSSETDAEGVASELGLYVAHEVWGEENGRGHVHEGGLGDVRLPRAAGAHAEVVAPSRNVDPAPFLGAGVECTCDVRVAVGRWSRYRALSPGLTAVHGRVARNFLRVFSPNGASQKNPGQRPGKCLKSDHVDFPGRCPALPGRPVKVIPAAVSSATLNRWLK